jgi:N-acetylglutamate synthase-like GNAT family acetyltransferase
MRLTMGSPDVADFDVFYSHSRSGCLVFDKKGEIGGVVCWDGTRGGEDLGTVLGAEEGEVADAKHIMDVGSVQKGSPVAARNGLRQRKGKGKEFSDVVQIRHLDVDHPYRRHGIGTELLASALDQIFSLGMEKVLVQTSPLGGDRIFVRTGFVNAAGDWPEAEKVGLGSWQSKWMALEKAEWVFIRQTLFAK